METGTQIGTGADYQQMLRSIEVIGEAGIDIVPLYFERFFGQFPDEQRNFKNPLSSQGAMVNEMVGTLLALAAEEAWVGGMMQSEMETHRSYGTIALQRYRDGLDCLIAILRESAGDRWSEAQENAWQTQCRRLFEVISHHH